MNNETWLSIMVPLLIAVLGYILTYLNNLRLAQRKERLDRIERQLQDLYGPLLSLSSAGHMAYYEGFKKMYRQGLPMWNAPKNDPSRAPTETEVDAFRLWARSVFIPLNEELYRRVVEHADLLVEPDMPQCLLDFMGNVTAYQGILAEWDAGDMTHHVPPIAFPAEIQMYAKKHYVELKRQQAKLLGET